MITHMVIEKRERFAGASEFADVGPYEKLVGKVCGEIVPNDRHNKIMVNIDKAPLNRQGNVQYQSDFYMLKPLDITRGNGKILYEAVSRGDKRILMFVNDAPKNNDPCSIEEAGNGFLMRQGYTIVWSGWQGDLIPGDNRLLLNVPVATDGDKEIIGIVRTEIVVTEEGIMSFPLSGNRRIKSYEIATSDKAKASLTVREKSYGLRIPVPTYDWDFALSVSDKKKGGVEIKPSRTDLYVKGGFKPGWIYEFIYLAKKPLVLGLGFAAVRDIVAFLRYEVSDSGGNPNPLALGSETSKISRAYAWGRSQAGRFVRDFVYHGFNEDEFRRCVFDAISPHAAGGGRLFLNYEFARPDSSSQQHTNQLDPEIFPFAYNMLKDAQTGKKDGILKRPKTDPYVFHTQTSTEYWQKRGCLVHTDGRGRDVRIPRKVRVYAFASAPHFAPFGSTPQKVGCQQLTNPLAISSVLRALIVAMDRWVCEGILPPRSQYPQVKDGTLVAPDQDSTGFPAIPGVRYTGLYNRQLFLDHGPRIMNGKIEVHPPKELNGGAYKILVPRVDADGNDIAGIRMPEIRVPIATYTGWNLQGKNLAEDELCGLLGSYIPFPRTKIEGKANREKRLSLEERYRDSKDFLHQIRSQVDVMLKEKFILLEDVKRWTDHRAFGLTF